MDDPADASFEKIIATCRDQVELLAESLNISCEQQLRLVAGDATTLAELLELPAIDQPGLVVAIEIESGVLLAAIPESLPLPEWYTHPDMEQKSRLGTLAMEWSMNCLPADYAATGFTSEAVPNLRAALLDCQPQSPGHGLLILGSQSDAEPAPAFWLAGPFARSPMPAALPAVSPTPEQRASSPAPMPANPVGGAPRPKPAASPLQRLLNIRVKLIVQLAEKKIELSQLMALGPGAIVTFEKSCEDLLELYVNNQLYCRGEAVKIGEKFGLKISEVGVKRSRTSSVLGLSR
jgi:flagellar motor switch protein FliN/FliY